MRRNWFACSWSAGLFALGVAVICSADDGALTGAVLNDSLAGAAAPAQAAAGATLNSGGSQQPTGAVLPVRIVADEAGPVLNAEFVGTRGTAAAGAQEAQDEPVPAGEVLNRKQEE